MRALFRLVHAVLFPTLFASAVCADEGGVSFWFPGQFGSLAAVKGEPGWSMPLVCYHMSVDAGGSKDLRVGGNVVSALDAGANRVFIAPTYAFQTPLWDAQAATGLFVGYGHMTASADAKLTGPRGRVFERNPSDSVTGGSDVYSLSTLKWNDGVNNCLAESSAVLGMTYNFVNSDTNYQNGVDAHLDWALSQFISEHMHWGLVGYFYQQITAVSRKWYVNLKGNYEIDTAHRPMAGTRG